MHEYSLTQNIIDTAARYAKDAAGNSTGKVTKVALVIGEAAGVSGESIKEYFDIIAKNTVCEEAVLEIETIKPMLKCKKCGTLFIREPFSFECSCGSEGEPTENGREFYIKYIETEQ